MTNVTVQEALKAAIETITALCNGSLDPLGGAYKTVNQCKTAIAEIEKCEPVAWKARFVADEFDTSPEWVLHFEAPEFRDDVEVIPLYTSPQHIEKCEPVAYIHKHYLNDNKDALDWHKREHPQFKMIPLYTSPQPRDWVGLSENDITALYNSMDVFVDYKDFAEVITSKLKQLNTEVNYEGVY